MSDNGEGVRVGLPDRAGGRRGSAAGIENDCLVRFDELCCCGRDAGFFCLVSNIFNCERIVASVIFMHHSSAV